MNSLTRLLIKHAPTFYSEETAESRLPVKLVGDYLKKNYGENVSLLDLAEHFGFSLYYLAAHPAEP